MGTLKYFGTLKNSNELIKQKNLNYKLNKLSLNMIKPCDNVLLTLDRADHPGERQGRPELPRFIGHFRQVWRFSLSLQSAGPGAAV